MFVFLLAPLSLVCIVIFFVFYVIFFISCVCLGGKEPVCDKTGIRETTNNDIQLFCCYKNICFFIKQKPRRRRKISVKKIQKGKGADKLLSFKMSRAN